MKLLRDLFSFHGRLGRAEYFGGLMLILIPFGVSLAQASLMLTMVPAGPLEFTGWLLLLAVSVWSWLAVTAKRLHDVGRPAWNALIVLVPFIGWYIAKQLVTAEGEVGDNTYGPDPERRPAGTA